MPLHAQDTSATNKFSHKDYISTKILRALTGEVILFYEHIDKKGRGNEFGLSYVWPSDALTFFTDFSPYQGDFQLKGVGLWFSRKYYHKKNSLIYFAPEIAFHYKYGDHMGTYVNQEILFSQQRYIASFAAKWGWRNKSGILEFYGGIGLSIRYTMTTFLNPPDTACHCENYYENKLGLAKGFSVFPVLRLGTKIGFPLGKGNKNSKSRNDTTGSEKFKHKDYFSVNLFRPLLGEIIVHVEHINKRGRGIEKGIGFIYPINQTIFVNPGDGTYKLYGVSFWLAEKFYFAEKNLFYSSPEFSLHLEYNGNMDRVIWYQTPSHISQSRIIPALTIKEGWRDKLGIMDLYIGAGVAFRYTQTTYLDNLPAGVIAYNADTKHDNGWYIYPILRAGVKLGFPIKTGKKIVKE